MNILRLHPEGGGPPVVIEQAIVRVGRDAGSDVHLRDASVSRHHAEIEKRGDDWVIVDQNSGNGIRVDGQRTNQANLLPGQQLHIGNLRFRVEIDRGNDGATMMLGRSPLLDDVTDQTLLAGAPPVFPPPPSEEKAPPRSLAGPITVGAIILIALAIGLGAYWLDQTAKVEEKAAATPAPTPFPTPVPTLTPEPTPPPTPAPTKRPTGTLLVSSDIATTVSVDGRVVARLKPAELRRVVLAPGEHIIRFESDDVRSETVARIRVNEQTVVRRTAEPTGGAPAPSPSPSASPTPQ